MAVIEKFVKVEYIKPAYKTWNKKKKKKKKKKTKFRKRKKKKKIKKKKKNAVAAIFEEAENKDKLKRVCVMYVKQTYAINRIKIKSRMVVIISPSYITVKVLPIVPLRIS